MDHVKTRGINMPKLGLGTFRMQGDACRDAVESALALGYRHIDTAEMYGNEEAIGSALTEPALIRRPSQQPEKTGSYREIRCIASPSTCSRASRATISG